MQHTPPALQPVNISSIETIARSLTEQHNPPIFHSPNQVTMRGGAGQPAQSGAKTTSHFGKDSAVHSTVGEDHMIYGYPGRLIYTVSRHIRVDAVGFRKIALRLTGYHENNLEWEICIDIPKYHGNAARTATVTDFDFEYQYEKIVRPYLEHESIWKLFVRRRALGGPPHGQLRPSSLARNNIIELHREGHGTAYLKVPQKIRNDQIPGINQIQKHFFPAIDLLFNNAPVGKINIDNVSLGVGAIEVTLKLWQHILSGYMSHKRVFEVSEGSEKRETGYVRLIGSHEVIEHAQGDLERVESDLRDNIEGLSAPAYRIWESPEKRASNERSVVIDIAVTEAEAVRDLKNFFETPGFVTVAPFRPEWRTFTVIMTAKTTSPSVNWTPKHGEETLDSFKAFLRHSFSLAIVDCEAFIMQEARDPAGDKRKFVIDRSTTEEEWRLNVFDWLRTSRFYFTPRDTYTFGKF